jgi:hypothetical protein
MASANEIAFARGVVRDSIVTLRWAASPAGMDSDGNPVVLPELKPLLAEAVEGGGGP